MSEEEVLICEHELRRKGYRYIWRFRGDGRAWHLRARKYPPLSAAGLREQPIEIRTPEDLARYPRP